VGTHLFQNLPFSSVKLRGSFTFTPFTRGDVTVKFVVRAITVPNCTLYVEIKCQLDATDLIACSTCFGHHYAHHQELKSIIQWLLLVVFRVVVFQVAGLVWS